MAGRRTARADLPRDPAAVLRALRACRDAMIEVCRCVKPMGPAYHAASMVISSIDAFATFLTGQRSYFFEGGSTANEGQLQEMEERRQRESGVKPWQP